MKLTLQLNRLEAIKVYFWTLFNLPKVILELHNKIDNLNTELDGISFALDQIWAELAKKEDKKNE